MDYNDVVSNIGTYKFNKLMKEHIRMLEVKAKLLDEIINIIEAGGNIDNIKDAIDGEEELHK